MTDVEKEFKKMVSAAGLPTTEIEAQAIWTTHAKGANSPFNNDIKYSPFWRAISKLVTMPVLWLVTELIQKQILPNFFLKTATGIFLDMFGWAVNCIRKSASRAVGTVQFSRSIAAGEVEIPIGSIVQSPTINGKRFSLRTTAPAVMIDGQFTISLSVEAIETGEAYNLAAGYYSMLATPIAGIDAVENLVNWLLSPGADDELDDDYRLRIRNQFSAANQYHTDAVYRKIITDFAGINTRNVFFQHDAPRGPGTANAFILLDVGQPSTTLLNAIQFHVMEEGNHGHGDDLQVMAMPPNEQDLIVTIVPEKYLSESDIEDLQSNIENAVRAAFRENSAYTMTLSIPYNNFSFSKLGGELHKLFNDLESVRFSLSDIETGLNVLRLSSLKVVVDD